MNGKKPTDDKEVIRLLEIFASDNEPDGVDRLAGMALDLIRRLQEENECLNAKDRLNRIDIDELHKEREKRVEEVYADFMQDYKIMREELNACQNELAEYERKLADGELDIASYARSWEEGDNRTVTCDLLNAMEQAVAVFNKQKSEIEVLKTELQKECQEHLAFAELAKKADEQQKAEIERLTAKNKQLDRDNKHIFKELKEVYKELEDSVEEENQAVKDTAKEIFTKIDNAFSLYYPHGQIPYSVFQETIKKLAKQKGVEVE